MKLNLRPFQGLQWKMMFPYILIIPLVILLIQIICLIASIVIIELFFMPALVLYADQQAAVRAGPFFAQPGQPDQPGLDAWLRIPVAYATYRPRVYAVVDTQGRVLAGGNLPAGVALQTRLSPAASARLQQVLAGRAGLQGMAFQDPGGSVIAIVPIRGGDQRIAGALYDDSGPNLAGRETSFWVAFYAPAIVFVTLFFAIFIFIVLLIGSLYTGRNFTRRFKKLTLAVDPWSRGDFSTFIQDASRDEIGELARRLNRMAEQLQNLLQTRQKLATLEERNRLARDLHDSIKQHIFVGVLQVGAAQLQLGEREAAARERLAEAEDIFQQVQQELATLIHALRPVALAERGLNSALRELVTQWSRLSGSAASLQIEGEGRRELPPLAEEALFRVVQEALANVMRHSLASSVQVQLFYTEHRVTLSIADNGHGFDPALREGRGIGLDSMRERIAAIGGELRVESAPGTGTSVVVHYSGQLMGV